MKAIIPVAGIGSRLRPHTHTQPKSLIPIAGKPILSHIVDKLRNEGVKDYVFVIGYLGDKIEKYIRSHYPDQENTFVIQTSGKGIGHAIWLTKEHVQKGEDIIIVLGDTIFETKLSQLFKSDISLLGLKKVEDPRQFGVAELDSTGHITKLVEKPAMPKSNHALVGIYYIKDTTPLFEALQYIIEREIKTQDEFHLTDALMLMIEKGHKFGSFNVDSWFDCGKKDILLQTNELLLKRLSKEIQNSGISENSIIIPPVYIGKNAKIRHSIIGPNVSIGEETVIDNCIIENSIIGPNAGLSYAVMRDSVIGNDAMLKGTVYTLNLGDSAEINFS
jgi:glucose-1-phosphate thymidylyltransferase